MVKTRHQEEADRHVHDGFLTTGPRRNIRSSVVKHYLDVSDFISRKKFHSIVFCPNFSSQAYMMLLGCLNRLLCVPGIRVHVQFLTCQQYLFCGYKLLSSCNCDFWLIISLFRASSLTGDTLIDIKHRAALSYIFLLNSLIFFLLN